MPDDAVQTILVDSNTGEWRRLPNGKETRTERDGTILIRDHVSRKKSEDEQDFFRNLAETDLGESILAGISSTLLEGIDSDNQSRADWLTNAAEAIKLLGLKIEPMRSSGADGAAPLEGMSTAHSPLLLEAVLRGQANASGELLPASGPVKVSNDRPPRPQQTPGAPIDNQVGSEAADDKQTILQRLGGHGADGLKFVAALFADVFVSRHGHPRRVGVGLQRAAGALVAPSGGMTFTVPSEPISTLRS